METPIQSKNPNKRRKLIKILKKKNFALQMQTSVSQVYHKKLKTAINVSLNSTRNVRTLQANNRSLASSLEKQKQNNRILNDAYQDLLKANHILRTKLLEMERFGYLSTSSLEMEVDRRVELKMHNIKEKLNGLSTCSQAVVDIVLDLTKTCSSKSSIDTSFLNSSLASLPVLPVTNLSLDDTGMDYYEDSFKDLEVVPGSFKKKSAMHEMSLIMEQSLLQPPDKSVPDSSLQSLTENPSTCPRKPYSKLPQRIPKQVNNDMGNANDLTDIPKVKTLAETSTRRATFTIAPVSLEEETLLETLAPPFLLSDESLTESTPDELQRFENLHAMSSKSPTQTEQADVQVKPQQDKIPSPSQPDDSVLTHLSDKLQNVKVKKPKSKSVKDHIKKKDKNMKIAPGFIRKDVPLIANEFALNIAHLQIMKKFETLQQNPQSNVPHTNGPQTVDKTILMVEDMELTMPLGKDFPNSTFSENPTNTIRMNMSVNNDVLRHENEAQSETVDGSLKFPDAVTMRISKPGQFVFAASRKESDGTRKAVPVVTKSRSRTKKLTAEMMEKLQQEEPQSIFDFHEKTPTSLSNSKKITVNNTATDELTSPQSKYREKVNSEGHEGMGIQTNTSVSSNQPPSLLGTWAEYQLPVKSSPDKPSSFNRTTRSRSHGKKLNPKSDNEIEANSDLQLPLVLDRRAAHELPHQGNPAHDVASFSNQARSKSRSRKLKADIDEATDVDSLGEKALYEQPLDSPSQSTRSSRKRTKSKSLCKKLINNSDVKTDVNSDHHLPSLHGNGQDNEPQLGSPSIYNSRKRSVSQSRNKKNNSDKEAEVDSKQKSQSLIGNWAEFELPLKDSPYNNNTKFKTRSRSKSHSRKLKHDSDEEAEFDSKQKSQSLLGNTDEYELLPKASPSGSVSMSKCSVSRSLSKNLIPNSDVEIEFSLDKQSPSALMKGANNELPVKGNPKENAIQVRGRPELQCQRYSNAEAPESDVDNRQLISHSAHKNLSELSICPLKTGEKNQDLYDSGVENEPNYRHTKGNINIDNKMFNALECREPNRNKNSSPMQQVKSTTRKTKKVADMKNIRTKKTDHRSLIPVKNAHNEPFEVEGLVEHQPPSKTNSPTSFETIHIEPETASSEPKQKAQSELNVEELTLPNIISKGHRKISPKSKNNKYFDKQSEKTNKLDSFSSQNLEPTTIMDVVNAAKVIKTKGLQSVLASQTKCEKMHKSPTTDETIKIATTNQDEYDKKKESYTSKSYKNAFTVNEINWSKADNNVYTRKKKAKDSNSQDSLPNKGDDMHHHTKIEDEFERKHTQMGKNPTLAYDASNSDTKRSLSLELDEMSQAIEEPCSSKSKSTKKKKLEQTSAFSKESENDSELSPLKRFHSEQISSSNEPDSKKRRAATNVNYAELKINTKLRRGDPFTSHYCTTDKLDIYKHKKKGNKKHLPDRKVLGSLLNQSIKEDE